MFLFQCLWLILYALDAESGGAFLATNHLENCLLGADLGFRRLLFSGLCSRELISISSLLLVWNRKLENQKRGLCLVTCLFGNGFMSYCMVLFVLFVGKRWNNDIFRHSEKLVLHIRTVSKVKNDNS